MVRRRKCSFHTSDKFRAISGSDRHLPYGIFTIITIILGLVSRKYGYFLPSFVTDNAGDMLWAMMVYFGFRFLLVRKGFIIPIILSFLFSFGIEFSQLYQAGWINQIRTHSLGGLVLGKGFLFVDLVRYSSGIVFAFVLDKVFISRTRQSPKIR